MRNAKPHAKTATQRGKKKQPTTRSRRHHTRGLLLVGLFKLGKAIFFAAVAAVTLHLVNHNLGALVTRLATVLPLDPDGHFVGLLMAKANLINNHNLRQAGLLSLGYSVCCLVEGTGLVMEKVWAEYFTLVLTVGALPLEVIGIVHHFSSFKIGLMAVNVVVLVYIVWLLRRKRLLG